MTIKACLAVILVAGYSLVFFIHIRLGMSMAVNAAEDRIVTGDCMALRAERPLSLVLSAIYREIQGVMIKS
jgi:hypothetical protein